MALGFSPVHDSWKRLLEPVASQIEKILTEIAQQDIAPARENIFRAFDIDLEVVQVVIFGQDPYPTKGNAMGLAFSVPENVTRVPASLRNIFLELESDLDIGPSLNGDLTSWERSGVLLLNRVLTTRVGESAAHSDLGWQNITNHIARELGAREVVAILWGMSAQELSQHFSHYICSAHPSPLSAYRGFFGSKPFSRVNELLISQGRSPINWSLNK